MQPRIVIVIVTVVVEDPLPTPYSFLFDPRPLTTGRAAFTQT